MKKRELIDKEGFWTDFCTCDSVHLAFKHNTITEAEIVRPYLTELRSVIVASIEDIKGEYDNTVPTHDKPVCKYAGNEVRLAIIEWIDDLLAELGDKVDEKTKMEVEQVE